MKTIRAQINHYFYKTGIAGSQLGGKVNSVLLRARQAILAQNPEILEKLTAEELNSLTLDQAFVWHNTPQGRHYWQRFNFQVTALTERDFGGKRSKQKSHVNSVTTPSRMNSIRLKDGESREGYKSPEEAALSGKK